MSHISFFSSYALMMMQKEGFKTAERAFCRLRDLGISHCDIVASDLLEYPLYMYSKMLEDCGIKPECMISTINVAETDDYERRKNIAISKERIDAAAKANLSKFMIAPLGFEAGSLNEWLRIREIMLESYSILTEYAKSAGISSVIENHSSVLRPDSKAEDVLWLIDNIPDIGYVLDTGNFFCIGEDVKKGYELLKDRIVHVHAKDWKWDDFGDQCAENMSRFRGCAIGEGAVPLKDVINMLKSDGYSGSMVIEINSGFDWKDLKDSVNFIASLMFSDSV